MPIDLDVFIRRHSLPGAFAQTATDFFLPLAQWVKQRQAGMDGGTFVLGINGAQGSGKSTLSNFLAEYLDVRFALNVVELSIDDLYLTRSERETLARDVHPLLMTRGAPGTHDVSLGYSVISALKNLKEGDSFALPRFDKSIDDREPDDRWPQATGPVDIIIFEGWCVGSKAQCDAELLESINPLEAQEDADATWRRYVNTILADDYPALFEQMDALVFLQAPSFSIVQTWRTEQEVKLREKSPATARGLLSNDEVSRFVQYFERITRENFLRLPRAADVVIDLGPDHAARAIRWS